MMHGRNIGGKMLIKELFGGDNYPGIAIELGVWKGSTTRLLAKKFKEVHAVDAWHVRAYENTTEWDGFKNYVKRYADKYRIPPIEENLQLEYEKVYKEVVTKLKGYDNVTIHRMTTKEFFNSYTGGADLIYVDGSHSYQDVYDDLICSWDILNDGGLIVCDDYDTGGWKPDVPKAINNFAKDLDLGYYVQRDHAVFKKES
jgi:hypothetical protein